uniref:Cyclic nucleotide-binding domain-containing protein n=1 Tax=Heterorhabditis bacteriophora TaxID=37862 RepID=A0A1I7WN92_HETBA
MHRLSANGMNSATRPSSGGGGGGIRGFFSKLRKPSDQLMQQRECDKLRSVLEQKAQSAASPGAPASPRSEQLGNDLKEMLEHYSDLFIKKVHQKVKAVLPADGTSQRSKKLAVSAEPTNFEQSKATTLQHHNKTAGSKQLIRDAVQKNDFLKQLAKEQIIELVECMYEMRARAGQWVIQEGEPGDRLFVVADFSNNSEMSVSCALLINAVWFGGLFYHIFGHMK